MSVDARRMGRWVRIRLSALRFAARVHRLANGRPQPVVSYMASLSSAHATVRVGFTAFAIRHAFTWLHRRRCSACLSQTVSHSVRAASRVA